jgi:hypothetical protein
MMFFFLFFYNKFLNLEIVHYFILFFKNIGMLIIFEISSDIQIINSITGQNRKNRIYKPALVNIRQIHNVSSVYQMLIAQCTTKNHMQFVQK